MAPPAGSQNPNRAESIPTQVFANGSIDVQRQVPANPLLAEAYNDLQQSVVRITNHLNPRTNAQPTEYGSGFIATTDGKVVTDLHVAQNAQSLNIQVGDKTYDAHVVRRLEDSDLTLLQIDSPNMMQKFKPLDLAASSIMMPGEPVGAFGYAEGARQMSFASGQFSQRLKLAQLLPYIKGGLMPGEDAQRPIDESVLPALSGTSGGPLFRRDLDGRWRVAGVIDMSDAKLGHADSTPVEAVWRLLGRQPDSQPAAATVIGHRPLFGMRRSSVNPLHFSVTPDTVPSDAAKR